MIRVSLSNRHRRWSGAPPVADSRKYRASAGTAGALLACVCLLLPTASFAQEGVQDCHIYVADQWIAVGATSLGGCMELARSAASSNEWQYARLGQTDIAVKDGRFFRTADGGRSWYPVYGNAAGTLGFLNVLKTPESPSPDEGQPQPDPAPASEPPAQASPSPAPTEVWRAQEQPMPEDTSRIGIPASDPAAPVPAREPEYTPSSAGTSYSPPSGSAGSASSANCYMRTEDGWVTIRCR